MTKISKILSQVSYQCNDVMTKLYISFVEVTGKGGSVIKENPQQRFPVVAVVWISIAILPVKIVNPKNDYSYVKANQKSGN